MVNSCAAPVPIDRRPGLRTTGPDVEREAVTSIILSVFIPIIGEMADIQQLIFSKYRLPIFKLSICGSLMLSAWLFIATGAALTGWFESKNVEVGKRAAVLS